MNHSNNQEMAYFKLNAEFEQQKLLLEKQSKRADQLQMALEILNRNLTKEKQQNEELLKKIENDKSDNQLLQSVALELKKAHVELDYLKQEKHVLEQSNEKRVEELKCDFAVLQTKQNELNEQNEQLHKEVATLQANNERLTSLQYEYDSLENAHTNAKAEIEQLNQANECMQTELSQLATSNNMLKNQYEHILEQSTEKQLQLEEQVIHLTSSLQVVTEEKELFEQQVKEQSSEIENYQSTIETLEIQVQFNNSKFEEQFIEIEALKKQMAQLKQALNDQQVINSNQTQLLEQSELKYEQLQSAKAETETLLNEQVNQIQQYKQLMEQVSQENKSLIEKVATFANLELKKEEGVIPLESDAEIQDETLLENAYSHETKENGDDVANINLEIENINEKYVQVRLAKEKETVLLLKYALGTIRDNVLQSSVQTIKI